MSQLTNRVEVYAINLEPHGNADTLSVVRIDGYTVVVNTEEWKNRKLGAYLPPDSLVDTTIKKFAWLQERARADGKCRIKALKLRGIPSFGLLVPIDEDLYNIGDDVTDVLRVIHYQPTMVKDKQKHGLTAAETTSGPNLIAPKYDIDNLRKYGHKIFTEGEDIIVMVKVHGANSRYVYHDGKMYCGSRTNWKAEYPSFKHIKLEDLVAKLGQEKGEEVYKRLQEKQYQKNVWWKVLENTPTLEAFCKANPDTIVYGEIYGAVQDLNYGCLPGEVKFAAFDVRYGNCYLDWSFAFNLLTLFGVPMVHMINTINYKIGLGANTIEPIKYNFDEICKMAEGKDIWGDHVREGVVVRSYTEKVTNHHRHILKAVGLDYLSRKERVMKEEDVVIAEDEEQEVIL